MEAPIGQIPEPQHRKPKGIADVVVCIDCTGSMTPCIEGVKTHVQKMVEGFQTYANLKLDWRVRLIEYRVLNCGESVIEYPFTTDIDEFRGQVQRLAANGGGDEPESTLDAIFKALQSDWRHSCNKCIVVFTDATTHPEMHSSTVESGQAHDVHEVINLIYQNHARLFLFAPKCETYDVLASAEHVIYREVPAANGLADVDFASLMEYIGKTVTASTEPVVAAQ